MFEDIVIGFSQIWYFDLNSTGWVGLQLAIVLTKTLGKFHCEWPLSNNDAQKLNN